MQYKIEPHRLVITCDPATQTALKDLGDDIHIDHMMYEYFEHLTCNGLNWVRPEDIGALTDAPLLSEGSLDDNGEWTNDAPVFWFEPYALRSPLEDLRDHGKVIFTDS